MNYQPQTAWFRGQRSATLLASLALLTITANLLKADTLLFSDLNDTFWFATTSTRISGNCIPIYGCDVTIQAPAGSIFGSSDIVETTPGPGDLGYGTNVAEPDGRFVSDSIWAPLTFPVNAFPIGYGSDLNGFPPVSCFGIFRCEFTEDGTVQTVGSVTWKDSTTGELTTDIIQVQSGVDVPEPQSIVLLVTALAAGGALLRRQFRERPPAC